MFVPSPDEEFSDVGKQTGIPYGVNFREYKKLLILKGDTVGIKQLFAYWEQQVFHGKMKRPTPKRKEAMNNADDIIAVLADFDNMDIGPDNKLPDEEEDLLAEFSNEDSDNGDTSPDDVPAAATAINHPTTVHTGSGHVAAVPPRKLAHAVTQGVRAKQANSSPIIIDDSEAIVPQLKSKKKGKQPDPIIIDEEPAPKSKSKSKGKARAKAVGSKARVDSEIEHKGGAQ